MKLTNHFINKKESGHAQKLMQPQKNPILKSVHIFFFKYYREINCKRSHTSFNVLTLIKN